MASVRSKSRVVILITVGAEVGEDLGPNGPAMARPKSSTSTPASGAAGGGRVAAGDGRSRAATSAATSATSAPPRPARGRIGGLATPSNA